MCVKGVDTCAFVFDSILDRHKTQKICDKVFFKDPFMPKYCLDRQKTQEMCRKAVDAFSPTLKCVPDWFLTRKMIKELDDVFSNDDIIFVNEDFDFVTFLVMKWVFLG